MISFPPIVSQVIINFHLKLMDLKALTISGKNANQKYVCHPVHYDWKIHKFNFSLYYDLSERVHIYIRAQIEIEKITFHIQQQKQHNKQP